MGGPADLHHDGSELYVSNPEPSLGEVVTLFVRCPHQAGVSKVAVRSTPNAEPHFVQARQDRRGDHETWWRADLKVENPVTGYRFLVDGGPLGYRWLTGAGLIDHDVTDATDFRVVAFDPPPPWVRDAVFYQIFPDRFAASGEVREWPPWALVSAWDDPVLPRPREAVHQVYGGDLPGVEARLDHLSDLGVDAVYMTPFFPAESSHRYNATSFEAVDPLLGGDRSLVSLVRAMHERGIRLIGDITTNHCGSAHEWFQTARRDPESVEASFFFRGLEDFEYWFGVRTLPKLDHRSAELRRRLYDGQDSVVAKWLRPPFGLDGWRVDVANMTGRLADVDLNRLCATTMRRTMASANPDAYLLAEHGYDASADLDGAGWHGVMSYAGFTRPLWCWLGDPDARRDWDFLGVPVPMPRFGGLEAATTVDAFRAAIPWRSWVHNLTLLGSHDTARWRSVAGDRDRALVGAGVLLTVPGVPCIFAGDEIGMRGPDPHQARQPFRWRRADWEQGMFERYRELVALRRSRPALRRGGFRWVHVGRECLAYLRETEGERILLQAARAPHEAIRLDARLIGGGAEAEALTSSPPLRGASSDELILPNDGPAFHAWRL